MQIDLDVVGAGTGDEIRDVRTIWWDRSVLFVPVREGEVGLATFDVATPSEPTLLDVNSEPPVAGASHAITDVTGTCCFLSDRNSGSIVSYDVSDPRDIVQLDSLSPDRYEGARRFWLDHERDVLFMAVGSGVISDTHEALVSIDVSDPRRLVELDYLTDGIPSLGYLAPGDEPDYLLCASYRDDKFGIVDISDPGAMEIVTMETIGPANSLRDLVVDADRGIVFVSDANANGIHALEVTDPREVRHVSFVSDDRLAGTRGISGDPDHDVIYASARGADLATAVDISDPTAMSVVASTGHETMDGCHGNLFADGMVWIGNADGGRGYVTVVEPTVHVP